MNICVLAAKQSGGRGGGGACSFVAFLSHLTIHHVSPSSPSTVPTPNSDASNTGALSTFLSCMT